MHKALNVTLGSLPDDTRVFVGCRTQFAAQSMLIPQARP
jgi:hypothetical protein